MRKALILIIVLSIGLFIAFRTCYSITKVRTGSMKPTLKEVDLVLIDNISYKFKSPKRGDIISFYDGKGTGKLYLKRIIGLPGEELSIRDGNIYIDNELIDTPQIPQSRHYYNREDWEYGKKNQTINIPDNAYFVLGDNSAGSSDSRRYGPIRAESVKGKIIFVF